MPSFPRALLIDLDGVLRIAGEPAAGAGAFLRAISDLGIPAAVLSNSTRMTGSETRAFFAQRALPLGQIPVMTALDGAIRFVAERYASAEVFALPAAREAFARVGIAGSEKPEAVVLGDLESGWSFDVLNRIFALLRSGADLVAMQRNRFWQNDAGATVLDAGAFVAALEYASGTQALLVGKPEARFFRSALRVIGLPEDSPFAMLGDDLHADIRAAQEAGGAGWLITTGKTDVQTAQGSSVRPDAIFADLGALTIHLQAQGN